MVRSLNEVLQDPLVLEDLRENPDTFSFKEAPTLILTMVSYPPHTFLNMEDMTSETVRAGIPTNFPIAGPMAYLLQILTTSMNFTYKQVLPPDGGFGVKTSAGNWTGMVGQLVRKDADVCLGPMQVIQSRTEYIDYTMPFSFGTLSLMAARGTATIDPWSFVLPLNVDVWIALFVSLLGVSFLDATFQWLMQPTGKWFILCGQALFDYSQPPLGNSIAREIRKWQRPIFGAWVITAFLLNASYEGTLRSMMALKYIPHPVQTLQDAIQDPSMKIIVMHRTSYTDIMSKVPSGDVRLLDDAGKSGRYVDRKIGDFMLYYDLVLRGDHVQVFDVITSLRYFALYYSNTGRCDFYIARETFIPTMYGMTLQKKSPLTAAFNARIIRIFEAGLYNQWTKLEVDNYTACLNPPIKVTSQDPIAFRNIWGLAVVWSMGMVLACIGFILELIVFKVHK